MPVSGTTDSQYSTAAAESMMRWHGMGSWDRYAHSNFIPSPHLNRLKNFIQKYSDLYAYSLFWKLERTHVHLIRKKKKTDPDLNGTEVE